MDNKQILLHIGKTSNTTFATLITEKIIYPESSFFHEDMNWENLIAYIKGVIIPISELKIHFINGISRKVLYSAFGDKSEIVQKIIHELSDDEFLTIQAIR